jgi:HEPN domain-containing protein
MGNRYQDWFRQAEADLQHAKNSLSDGDFEWSCFASHQAAEKALKAVFFKRGLDAWGHTLTVLIGNLSVNIENLSSTLVDYARILVKYYIPTRYPNSFDSGAPADFYNSGEAQSAIQQAEANLEFFRPQFN